LRLENWTRFTHICSETQFQRQGCAGLRRGLSARRTTDKAVSQARSELGILSSSAAAKAVRRARTLGFLGPTEKGKAGGAIRPRREPSMRKAA